jgi:hypothetical protein
MSIVHKALRLNQTTLKVLRWFTLLAATVGITCVYYPLVVIFFSGLVVPEGFCIQYSFTPFVVLIFALTDLTLSMVLLILFVVPLTYQARSADNRQNQSDDRNDSSTATTARDTQLRLRHLARKNLWISSGMMVSTLSMLFFMLHSMNKMNEALRDLTPSQLQDPVILHTVLLAHVGFIQMLHTVFGIFDCIVTVTLCHVISGAWIPKRVQNWFSKLKVFRFRSSTRTKRNIYNPAGHMNHNVGTSNNSHKVMIIDGADLARVRTGDCENVSLSPLSPSKRKNVRRNLEENDSDTLTNQCVVVSRLMNAVIHRTEERDAAVTSITSSVPEQEAFENFRLDNEIEVKSRERAQCQISSIDFVSSSPVSEEKQSIPPNSIVSRQGEEY